jgi:hypothetical protein
MAQHTGGNDEGTELFNTGAAPLMVGGTGIPPHGSAKVKNWESYQDNAVVKSWLESGVLTTSAPPADDQAKDPAPPQDANRFSPNDFDAAAKTTGASAMPQDWRPPEEREGEDDADTTSGEP